MALPAAKKATSGQRKASDPAASAWVSANAGSGKTHVLANRVIRLLLNGTLPQRVLCLTFTKAAAAEMSNRIFKLLGDWVTLDDDQLVERVHGVSGQAVFEPEQLARARRLFAQALETPGGLKVQTIHAFCESLLQRFPLEADVVPGFGILEERGSRQLLSDSRASVLSAAAANGHALNVPLKIVVSRVQAPDFDRVLNELLSKRRKTSGVLGPQAVGARLRTLHRLAASDTIESVVEAAVDDCDDTQKFHAIAQALMRSGANDQQAALRIETYLGAALPDDKFMALLALFFTATNPAPRKTLVTKSFAQQHPDWAGWLDERKSGFQAAYGRYKSAVVIYATEALLTIADSVIERYQAEKRNRSLLDYDDLIQNSLKLFDSSNAAWILYKLDGGLDHILVDEAQDTSPEQWRIIADLSEEFFAGEGARDLPRTVFAVGDEKQSIFSFQGADPVKFDEMRRYFKRQVERSRATFSIVPLTVSFRSAPVILQAVDWVFESPEAARGLTREPASLTHEAHRSGQPGLIEIWPTVEPDAADDQDDPWYAPLDRESPGSPRSRLAERIAETISGWIRNGEPLASKDRPVRAGDILVLVRRRNAFVDALVRALKSRQVPVAGTDRLILADHIAVMDLLALARFVLLPEDDLTLATVIKSPLLAKPDGAAFDDADLFAVAYRRSDSLWSSLQRCGDDQRLAPAIALLADWRGRAGWQQPYEFFTRVLGPDKARERFIERLGTEANDPIDEFLNLALQYERTKVPSLQGFVDWVTAADTQIKRDMEHGTDEVRVMTVHGAKGLEANIVILPDTCAVPDQRHDPKILDLAGSDAPDGLGLPVWPIAKAYETEPIADARAALRAKQKEEYNRLLYVAMTRARDRLYICGYETKSELDAGCWYQMIFGALVPQAREITDGNGDHVCYRIEDPRAQTTEPERDLHAVRSVPETPPVWARAVPEPEPRPHRILAPSRLELDADRKNGETVTFREQPVLSPLTASDTDRFRRGRLIHTLLQSLPEIASDEQRNRASSYLAYAAGDLEEAERDEIVLSVMRILEHRDFTVLFGPDSRAEVPVSGRLPVRQANGEAIVISGKIDRLVVTPEEVLIVDYKTNRPAPRSLGDVTPLYLRQIAAYRLALTALFPHHAIRGLLLWTDGPRLMEIPVRTMESALPVA